MSMVIGCGEEKAQRKTSCIINASLIQVHFKVNVALITYLLNTARFNISSGLCSRTGPVKAQIYRVVIVSHYWSPLRSIL